MQSKRFAALYSLCTHEALRQLGSTHCVIVSRNRSLTLAVRQSYHVILQVDPDVNFNL
jgi:hypothetical protein